MTDRNFSPQQGQGPQESLPEGPQPSTMIQREEMNMPRQYSEQQQLQENEGEGENTRLPVSEEEFRMVQELQAIQAGHDKLIYRQVVEDRLKAKIMETATAQTEKWTRTMKSMMCLGTLVRDWWATTRR